MKRWSECLCGNYVLSYKNCQSTVPENTVPWLFLITASYTEVYFLLYLMSHPRLRHLLDDRTAFFLCSLDYFFCNFNTFSIGNPENLEISSGKD